MNNETFLRYQQAAPMRDPSSSIRTFTDPAEKRLGFETAHRTRSTDHALDQLLADSFPASDPPPWTLGVARTHTNAARHAEPRWPSAGGAAARDGGWSSRPYAEEVIVLGGGFRSTRTLAQGLASLVGAIGVALFVPIAILTVGLPIAFAVRILGEAVALMTGWVPK